ncbi:hypothetical protein M422DRAFT_273593 [Sphaerobolus stellatus SS14]|uniref:Uncharacterized protein n=1 Tax=Sphaerobolus stellatus (strain SS14) TaxID=990650 RepID=A0A0C9U8U9_SPHS4|nr:hypothetical protein M422DRAFT_273593 [Sphaerobolus stellatus SS14]
MGGWTTAAARATTAQNLTRLYLPLDLSLLLGDLIILVNPSLRQRSSSLGLGYQANPVPHPATSSRFDDPSPGSSLGPPHNTNTVMSGLGSAFERTVSMGVMGVATGMVASRAQVNWYQGGGFKPSWYEDNLPAADP